MDSDRDYSYEELLQRVFGIMRDKNPEMVAGEKKKFVMRPPQVKHFHVAFFLPRSGVHDNFVSFAVLGIRIRPQDLGS